VGVAATAVAANAPSNPRRVNPFEGDFVITAYCIPFFVPSIKPTVNAHPQATVIWHDGIAVETVLHCNLKQLANIGGNLLTI
jgi:hypothetical protein